MQQHEFKPMIHCFQLIGGRHSGKTIVYLTVTPKDFVFKNGKYLLKQWVKNQVTLLSREPIDGFGWEFMTQDQVWERIKNLQQNLDLLIAELDKIKNPIDAKIGK